MKAKIAVATVSGKAYFRLVKELKEQGLLFLSLVPGETIPSTVKVVITTEREKSKVVHPNIIVYDEEDDPKKAIQGVLSSAHEKDAHRSLIVGVDPGKTFGVAVLCDQNLLTTRQEISLEDTVDTILSVVKENPAPVQIVKIGNGVPELANELAGRLRKALPSNVKVEIVSEERTSLPRERRKGERLSDADSAARIAQKRGR